LADVVTSHFVPVVTALAIITWLVWLSLGLSGVLPASELTNTVGGWPAWSLEFAIAVFIIACPCGIGLAAPTALLVGSGLAAKYGILVRGGGEAFQDASRIDVMVFDKTGTLTEGSEPKVTDTILPSTSQPAADTEDTFEDESVISGVVTHLASASSHPLCLALRDYFRARSVPVPSIGVLEVEELPGRGMKGYFRVMGPDGVDFNVKALMGNELLLREHSVAIGGEDSKSLHRMKLEGKSVVLLATSRSSLTKVDDALSIPLPSSSPTSQSSTKFSVSALFGIADPIRPEAQSVIARLHSQGVETWMISGDNSVTAGAVAKLVGIPSENVMAGVLPHQKAEKVQWLQNIPPSDVGDVKGAMTAIKAKRRVVAMVGDGINDAPALTIADIGIAIGSGSDVALSSAKFVLLSSNLNTLLTLVDLSKKVFRRIKFNFVRLFSLWPYLSLVAEWFHFSLDFRCGPGFTIS